MNKITTMTSLPCDFTMERHLPLTGTAADDVPYSQIVARGLPRSSQRQVCAQDILSRWHAYLSRQATCRDLS